MRKQISCHAHALDLPQNPLLGDVLADNIAD